MKLKRTRAIVINWKTSICGLLEFSVAAYSAYLAATLHPQFRGIFIALAIQQVVSGIAHLLARDADKSSEKTGVS